MGYGLTEQHPIKFVPQPPLAGQETDFYLVFTVDIGKLHLGTKAFQFVQVTDCSIRLKKIKTMSNATTRCTIHLSLQLV